MTRSLPSGDATLAYPPGWRLIKTDPGTVTAARKAGGQIVGYLNITPQGGDETLANWASFRPAHNREEGDHDVVATASAIGPALSQRAGVVREGRLLDLLERPLHGDRLHRPGAGCDDGHRWSRASCALEPILAHHRAGGLELRRRGLAPYGRANCANRFPIRNCCGLEGRRSRLCCSRGQGHREADPPALADLLPDGPGEADLGARDQARGGGVQRHERRRLRAPLLRRPRGAREPRHHAAGREARREPPGLRVGALLAAARRTTTCPRSSSATTSWRRCRPRCSCWTASSPTPSRCGWRCSRSPGAGRAR